MKLYKDVVRVMVLSCCVMGAAGQQLVVTSAADFGVGLPSGGSIASVFCAGLKGIDTIKLPPSGVVAPLELAGVTVSINGRPAPLLSVAPVTGFYQINLQVPSGDSESSQSDVVVKLKQGELELQATIPIRGTSPGEFFRSGGVDGIFQRINVGYSLVTPQSPARAGDTLVAYLTGLPTTRPAVLDGVVTPQQPLSIVPQYNETFGTEKFSVVIDGRPVDPLFVGLTPGMIGLYQVNFVMPTVATNAPQVVLLRESCGAIFGSCSNGGGLRTSRRSNAVVLYAGQ